MDALSSKNHTCINAMFIKVDIEHVIKLTPLLLKPFVGFEVTGIIWWEGLLKMDQRVQKHAGIKIKLKSFKSSEYNNEKRDM